jgi:transcriptional regulator with XRE-family HTH domain
MAITDFAQNLKLLCGYGKSITDICLNAGINRPQFNKYLSGKRQPSLQTLRKICDYFGIDDHEIFLDHESFSSLIRVRPPVLGQETDLLYTFVDKYGRIPQHAHSEFDKYVGFYHAFYQPNKQSGTILCNLFTIYKRDNCLTSAPMEQTSGIA